ncbi:MAG: hypothetical protein AAF296_00470 [Pseudomonadota bacterium]
MISSFASIRQAQIPAIVGVSVCALLLTACTDGSDLSNAAERLQSPYVESVEEIPPFYYRVQASYTLKETGEQIDFDYVVACGGIATRWTYTSPSRMTSYHPKSMFHPTSNGEAIGVRSPDMCNPKAWGWEDRRAGKVYTREDTIPDDFLPVTICYPNVNRMGWGIGYESDVAYESPYAKIAFNGASITESNQEEWQAWRDRAEANYEQIGGLPGP